MRQTCSQSALLFEMLIDEVKKQNFKHLFAAKRPKFYWKPVSCNHTLDTIQYHHNLHHISTLRPRQSSGSLCNNLCKALTTQIPPWRAEQQYPRYRQELKSSAMTSWRKDGAEQRIWPQLGAQSTG